MADIEPTDPKAEREKGRVPLWLDPDDLHWLSRHCCCPQDASEEERDRFGRIRFRAGAALHKHGRGR
ncbi:hypothetical protein [Streptomyces thermolilacinus]|uniref:Uncharacterized protein n=1 Tax=Streptomyces thermolilacinus SPC6 TaxID=1306406 RepID=A0A1D3DVD0_9ACTN|nr:hypothetical protein [Streptomyces thermolilacinus]OEJ96278.1 hypothetical protein J116_019255 [Streptomyces thermolilacinus SPC6]